MSSLEVGIIGTPAEGYTATAVVSPSSGGGGGGGGGEGTGGGTVLTGRRMPWRFIFTDLRTRTTTWAQGIQYSRKYTETLGDASMLEGAVDSDDFRVNGIWTDDYPRVAQSNRLVYAFRREGGLTPWQIRAAGILMSPTDTGDATSVVSHWLAYDPRKLLEALPVVKENGTLVGPDGWRPTLFGVNGQFATADELVVRVLLNAITYLAGGDGAKLHIDAGPSWGGTSFWNGQIDTCAPIDLSIQQGQMVADVWKAVEDGAYAEIRLTPIYDPVNRPGYTHELSVRRQIGVDRYDCVFGWDKLNRALNKIERVHDATPGSFFNTTDYFAGQGGPASAVADGPVTNPASIADFGPYWSTQWFPSLQTSVTDAVEILALAKQALVLSKQGKRTLNLDVNPERAKVPLRDYRVGDRIMVHATRRLRVTSDGKQRVQTIPIDISDDGAETVTGLIVTPDFIDYTPAPSGQGKLFTVFASQISTTVAARSMNVTKITP